MTAREIRRNFLDFFAARDHDVVPSSPLIPKDDPTILFANAGMNQFKRVFQGLEPPRSPRAASVQKCIRAGGKHNDLENVGMTARHHTFFEMLGNFSFGDYFKEDAIAWAWEWVTKNLGLPADRLYATVYTEDEEAAALWAKIAPELGSDRILRFGKHDNYWAMGDTGPHGPCSEIHFDRGEHYACERPDCRPNCECDRFMEIWNLVFMQFNTDEQGKTSPLPASSVDTGAGLERIAAILQNAETNYDTDLFQPIIRQLAGISGQAYAPGPDGTSHRVVADHLRALAFSIADGAVPSNEGRGYVLRRILRRAARHGHKLGMHEPFLARLLPTLIDVMGADYPELGKCSRHITTVLTSEEEQFGRTLDLGCDLFGQLAGAAESDGSRTISGEAVFKLYDTYGFPVDLTAVMARERNLQIDETGYETAMSAQRERSRSGAGFRAPSREQFATIRKRLAGQTSEFLYDTYETTSKLLDYAPNEGAVILDRTPFYVESGGQVSDMGMITADDFVFDVKDVIRDGDLILHIGEALSATETRSDTAMAQVAVERRRAIERNHTATHLLHAALRQVLGDHVHQAGSLVAPDRLRFDFAHQAAVTSEELEKIEIIANARILDNIPLQVEWSDFDSARDRGAMALFGEKYDDTVRVVSVPGFSMELCGGTHVQATGAIGLLRIVSESAVAAGVRRIEAVTGEGALQWSRRHEQLLDSVSALLKSETDQLPLRVEKLLERQRQLEQKVRDLETQAARQAVGGRDDDTEEVDGHRFTVHFGSEWQRNRVEAFADELKKQKENISGVFGFVDDERGKVSLFVAASAGAIEAGVHAGKAVQHITGTFDGRGGGKPNLGQGGFAAGDMTADQIESRIREAVVAYFNQV